MSRRLSPLVDRITQHARIALLLFVLAAMGAQQLVAQAHWHALPVADASVSAPTGGSAPADKDCLWCHIASHASVAAAPPAPLQLLAATEYVLILVPAGYESDVPVQPAHAWLSRGPPAA
jgi:hypothetical protein